MGDLPHIPPELIALIVSHLHNDTAALKACSLVSSAFLPSAQAYLFENIKLWFRLNRNIESMRACIPPDPSGVLSHTRNLALFYPGIFLPPSVLDEIFDHFTAFSKVRELRIRLDTSHFVDRNLTSTSRYFSHFRPTLRSLDLTTFDRNPKDLVAFITFFPFLEELSLLFYDAGPAAAPDRWVGELDPNILAPLRGTLRIHTTPHNPELIMELTKVRILYHTLELGGHILSPGTGMPELLTACAPTLRVLKFLHSCRLFSFLVMGHELNRKLTDVHHSDLDSWMTFAACTQLAEIRLPAFVDQHRDTIRFHAALASTISSPGLRRIELAFNGKPLTREVARVFSRKRWGALEDVLLDLAQRNRNTVQLVMSFQDNVQLPRRCDEFMSRFREVGEVRFEVGS